MFKNNISPLRRKGFKARLLRIKAKTMYGLDYIGGITTSGAVFGKSLYQLSNTYTGYCLRVHRQSDNATLDIGFVSGYVDITSIEAFCTGTNGRVTIWYDQCGGNNAEQTSFANMPTICTAGVFEADGIRFVKANVSYLVIGLYSGVNIKTPPFAIYMNNKGTASEYIFTQPIAPTYVGFGLTNEVVAGNFRFKDGGANANIAYTQDSNNIHKLVISWKDKNLNGLKCKVDGFAETVTTKSNDLEAAILDINIGTHIYSAAHFNGHLITFIIFNSDIVYDNFDILKTKC